MITIKKIIIVSVVILVAFFGYQYVANNDNDHRFIIVQKGDIIEKVSVTGRVEPIQNIKLAFIKSGIIKRVFFNIGDRVENNQVLVRLDNTELQSQLKQANAKIENTKATLIQYFAVRDVEQVILDEIQLGIRKEEVDIMQAKVMQANQTFKDASTMLVNIRKKALIDLAQDYDDALVVMQKMVQVSMNTLITITNIQDTHFTSFDQNSTRVADPKANAIFIFLGGENAGRLGNEQITELGGGAKSLVMQAKSDATHTNINTAIIAMQNTLQAIQVSLDVIPIIMAFTTVDTSNIASAKTNIAGEIILLSEKQNKIALQKIINQNNITDAQAKVNNAKNILHVIKSELMLMQAGSTLQQIEVQKAKIKQADANILSQKAQVKETQANVQNITAQLAKTILRAPFDGIITKQDAKVGEIIPANTNIVSLISEKEFEIKANIPETDITKINIGDKAYITLDAYGGEIVFKAEIIMIDPAETVIEGIATYEITLQFIDMHKKIKPGMTANIDIESNKKEDVVIIPQRLIAKGNGNIGTVTVVKNKNILSKEITFGLTGSDGNIEIINGLNVGEFVLIKNLF